MGKWENSETTLSEAPESIVKVILPHLRSLKMPQLLFLINSTDSRILRLGSGQRSAYTARNATKTRWRKSATGLAELVQTHSGTRNTTSLHNAVLLSLSISLSLLSAAKAAEDRAPLTPKRALRGFALRMRGKGP